MNIPQIILRKRDGGVLTPDEIRFVIEGYTRGEIPDYQMSALLMAIFFKGMSEEELDPWTDAMVRSGRSFDLGGIKGAKIDKHSTGGVGDKVSLPLAPLAAACGLYVPMISGRGLGHTGGTLDKLESIPGMNVKVDEARFLEILRATGLVFAGQTKDICPADRKLYALRDVTGTVESIPLISSSIMSKKIAEGIGGLVLDIKVGRGAFMKDRRSARALAETMIRIGKGRAVKVKAVLTAMDQPLGRACGNGIEMVESMEVLHGRGPDDLVEVVLHLTAWMLVLGGIAGSVEEAKEMCRAKIRSGEALERMKRVVKAQGGDERSMEDLSLLPVGKCSAPVEAPCDGWVRTLDAYKIGIACIALGAGRTKTDDGVDYGAGIYLHKKEGEKVARGEALATLYCNSAGKILPAREIALGAYEVGGTAPRRKQSVIIEEL